MLPAATADELVDTIVYLASPGAVNVIDALVLSSDGRCAVQLRSSGESQQLRDQER